MRTRTSARELTISFGSDFQSEDLCRVLHLRQHVAHRLQVIRRFFIGILVTGVELTQFRYRGQRGELMTQRGD